MNTDANAEYWNHTYTGSAIPDFPSQFAAFVLGEVAPADTIIDIGCGNGRDSFFFGRHGMKVLGVDSSREAIARCSMRREQERHPQVDFLCQDIGSPEFLRLIEERAPRREGSRLIYARFFLHAITPDLQDLALRAIAHLMAPSDRFACEFRTQRDSFQPKVASPHYRSFITPAALIAKMHAAKLNVLYHVEGFGLAKRGSEDPHVARIVACPDDAEAVELRESLHEDK